MAGIWEFAERWNEAPGILSTKQLEYMFSVADTHGWTDSIIEYSQAPIFTTYLQDKRFKRERNIRLDGEMSVLGSATWNFLPSGLWSWEKGEAMQFWNIIMKWEFPAFVYAHDHIRSIPARLRTVERVIS